MGSCAWIFGALVPHGEEALTKLTIWDVCVWLSSTHVCLSCFLSSSSEKASNQIDIDMRDGIVVNKMKNTQEKCGIGCRVFVCSRTKGAKQAQHCVN